MDSKDAYDIALKIADLYFKVLQFFIAICTLFGGWIVLQDIEGGMVERMLLAVIFVAATGTLVLGQVSLLRRADAAICLSRKQLETGAGPSDADIRPLFAVNGSALSLYTTVAGMGSVIAAIVVLIFLSGS